MLNTCRCSVCPNPEQEAPFRRTVGCCRLVDTLGPEQRRLDWHRGQPRRLTGCDQVKEVPAPKDGAVVPARCTEPSAPAGDPRPGQGIQELLRRACGLSAFRGRGDSFRYPDPKRFKIEAARIFPPRAGWVSGARHRPLEGMPKTATVSREAAWWSVPVRCEVAEPRPNRGPAVVDLGVATPMALSAGEVVMLPRTGERGRRKLPVPGPAAQERRAQGDAADCQESRRHRHRGSDGATHDGERGRDGRGAGPERWGQGGAQPLPARRRALADPPRAGGQGDVARRQGRCRAARPQQPAVQPMRARPRGQPRQPVGVSPQSPRRRRERHLQRRAQYPQARHRNRRTSGRACEPSRVTGPARERRTAKRGISAVQDREQSPVPRPSTSGRRHVRLPSDSCGHCFECRPIPCPARRPSRLSCPARMPASRLPSPSCAAKSQARMAGAGVWRDARRR
jgi:hypothetical protein